MQEAFSRLNLDLSHRAKTRARQRGIGTTSYFCTFEPPGSEFWRVKLGFLAAYFMGRRANRYHRSRRCEYTNPPSSLTALFTYAKCELEKVVSKLQSTMSGRHACSRNLFYRCAPHHIMRPKQRA